ncbi:hypothetical protein L7F22_037279 [Adiantum nelumboides]|nr:hypothetical protein [Adiantum nelumboides]
MALPQNIRAGLLPSEAEYLATSDVEINIVPLMRMDRVRLLDGIYGPLRPPTQARVPLWLAINLKKRKRCSIVCPDWLLSEQLKKSLQQETMQDEFAPLPLHYLSISKVLLESAPEDIPESDDVRAYLKSIREARQSKILSGVEAVNTEHLGMTNISLGEVTELRQFLSTAFNHLRAIQQAGESEEQEETGAESMQGREYNYSVQRANQESETPNQQRTASYTTPYNASTAAPSWSASRQSGGGVDRSNAASESQEEESGNNMDLF